MNTVVFSIAKDFSPHPGPRFARQGANSGEALRQQLMRLLKNHPTKLLIDLDGTKGIGSSFLDEAFGGLVRSEHMSKNELLNCFEFRSTVDPSYIAEIVDSIRRAEPTVAH